MEEAIRLLMARYDFIQIDAPGWVEDINLNQLFFLRTGGYLIHFVFENEKTISYLMEDIGREYVFYGEDETYTTKEFYLLEDLETELGTMFPE